MAKRQYQSLRSYIKAALILASLAFAGPAIAARTAMLGASLALLLYLGLLGGLVLSIWGAAFVRHPWWRWGWAFIFGIAALLVGSFEIASGEGMTYDAFVTMVHSAAFAGDAASQYGASMFYAGTGAMLLMIGVGLRPEGGDRLPRWLPPTGAFAGFALLTALLFWRGGEGARGLPWAPVGAAYAALYAIEAATAPREARQSVRIPLRRAAGYQDIVLIIDESVAGRYLDINDPHGVRSGLASPPTGVSVSNFGLAASVTNCSYGSNMTLRHGGTRTAYHRINAAMPSIFAYAKAAGLATWYVDAQRTGGHYQNGMDEDERKAIDHFVQFGDVPVLYRDMAAAGALIRALGNDQRDFILINKMGAHFPVADKYPADQQIYRPALPRSAAASVTEMPLPENLYRGSESWRRYRNAYRNSLTWTVGGFFDKLFAEARLDDVLLVYTSDHGQDLHERGGPGTTTHCSPYPASEEGAVPLVLIDSRGDWAVAASRAFDGASHYRIFPTLLNAMGYDHAEVERTYGYALDARVRDPMTFNSLFHARLGQKPKWVEVKRDRVARPPVGDHSSMER